MLEQAAEGIFILDEKLNYIDVNPYYEKLTGFLQAVKEQAESEAAQQSQGE